MDVIFKSYGLTKKYGNQAVVNQVDMTVSRGDIYGFVGENGAGKTTIIRLICGLIAPSAGSFELFGCKNDSPGINAVRRRMSAIVEAPSLYNNMNAYDNILEQCKILGISPDRYRELMTTVGLEEMVDSKRKVKDFSLGMKQRLAIAMSLVGSPEFIILDEPLNGLDPKGIVDMRELIRNLNQEKGITFLISSHILRELSLVATKYGIISRGRLLAELSAKELHERCRRSIDIETDNNAEAHRLLSSAPVVQRVEMYQTTLRVYTDADVGDIVSLLSGAGLNIKRISDREDSLEDFYLELTGGDRK